MHEGLVIVSFFSDGVINEQDNCRVEVTRMTVGLESRVLWLILAVLQMRLLPE